MVGAICLDPGTVPAPKWSLPYARPTRVCSLWSRSGASNNCIPLWSFGVMPKMGVVLCGLLCVTDGSCLVVGISPSTLQGSPSTGNQGELLLPTTLQDTKGL